MSKIDDRFHKDALWQKLKGLREGIDELETPESDQGRDVLEYLTAIVDRAAAREDGTPPSLVTPKMLTSTSQAADQIQAQIDPWQSGQATDDQVMSVADALAQALAAWPPMTAEQLDAAHERTTKALRDRASELIRELETQRDGLQESVGGLEQQATELEAKLEAQQEKLASALTTFAEDTSKDRETAGEEWDTERSAHKEKADQALERLRELEKEARDLVHAGTAAVVATDYGEYAASKSKAGWLCDIGAAIIGGVGVAAIILHLYRADTGADGDVGLSLTRLAASLGTLGIAALVAHRGSEHHDEARAAKRTDLALRRVGPFTANLDADIREQIVVDTTDRIFVKGELDRPTGDEGREPLWGRIQRMRRERATTEDA